jgi:hypothetical protein
MTELKDTQVTDGAGDSNDRSPPPSPPVTARRTRGVELAGWLGLILILAAMAGIIAHRIDTNPGLSPRDEVAHADYLYKASQGGIARLGQKLGPDITREMSCRGVESVLPSNAVPCPGNGDPASVPGVDNTHVDIHPPTYYYVTAALSRPILAVAPFDSLITAGRLVSIVWFGAGLILFYVLLKDLRVGVPVRLAVCLLIALQPTLISHLSMVNVVATTFGSCAFLMLAVVRWEQRRWPVVLPVLAAAVCLALKADNTVPVFTVCLYLMLRALVLLRSAEPAPASVLTRRPGVELDTGPDAWPRVGRDGHWRRYVIAAVLIGAGAAVTELTWLLTRRALAMGPPLSNPGTLIFYRTEIRIDDLISQLSPLVLPLGPIDATLPLAGLASMLLLGAYVGAMLHRRVTDPLQTWGAAVTVGATIGGVLLVIGSYYGSQTVFPLPGRYGFGLVAAMAMLLALALRGWLAALALVAAVVAFALVGPVTAPSRTDIPKSLTTPGTGVLAAPSSVASPEVPTSTASGR